MARPYVRLTLTLALALSLVGCGTARPHQTGFPSSLPPRAAKVVPTTGTRPIPNLGARTISDGQVLILEYHNFGPRDERWSRSPDGFLDDLTHLYSLGFRPVNLGDMVRNRPDSPVGSHPVVLTFDDGDRGQFAWGPNGEPDPSSAVGVLLAFHKSHPDWALRGTFFVNNNPFGADSATKVRYLVEHGFEIGNHTLDHVDVGNESVPGIESEIGQLQEKIATWVPGYQPISFALPYGALPTNPTTEAAILNGHYGPVSWHFRDVVLVGAGPAPAPSDPAFRPFSLPRIQVADPATASSGDRPYLLDGWLKRIVPSALATVRVLRP